MSALFVFAVAAEEPITADEANYHCRVDLDSYSESVLMDSLIQAARAQAETILKRYLVTQTIDAYFDCFRDEFLLPPLQSVTSITYFDTNGIEQTLSASGYLVDAKSQPARITPSYGNVWPVARMQNNSVKIRFIAGYGAASAVPQCIKNWMMIRVKTLYESRDQIATSPGTLLITDSFIDGLLDSEKVRGL